MFNLQLICCFNAVKNLRVTSARSLICGRAALDKIKLHDLEENKVTLDLHAVCKQTRASVKDLTSLCKIRIIKENILLL